MASQTRLDDSQPARAVRRANSVASERALASTTGVDSLQRSIGNRATGDLLRSLVQRNGASGALLPHPIQRQPVKLEKQNPDGTFFRDDLIQGVILVKEGAPDRYRINGTNEIVYWQTDQYVTEVSNAPSTTPATLKAYQSMPMFEEFATDAKLAVALGQPGKADADLQRALSMYVLNKFYANAMYTSDEIARLAYQASPLNFQAHGAYIRSEATAFVDAQKKSMGLPTDATTNLQYYLARNMDFTTMLGQMFSTIRATPVAEDLRARVVSVVGGIARDLVGSGGLSLSRDPHQRALTFVDVSQNLATHTGAIDAKLKECVTDYQGAVATMAREASKSSVIAAYIDKNYPSVDTTARGNLERELGALWEAPGWKAAVAPTVSTTPTTEQKKKFEDDTAKAQEDITKGREVLPTTGKPAPDESELLAALRKYMSPYQAWLKKLPATAVLCKEDQEFKAATGGDVRPKFLLAAKSDQNKIGEFLTAQSDELSRKQPQASQQAVWTQLVALKKQSVDIPSLIMVGGMIKVGQQPVLAASHAVDEELEKHVKLVLNKSGYVPTPSVASEQMLTTPPNLQQVLENIAQAQMAKEWSKSNLAGDAKLQKEHLESFILEIANFKPETYTTSTAAVDQLARTKKAFEEFEKKIMEGEEHVKLLGRSLADLIKGINMLDTGAADPVVLQKLEKALNDSVASRDQIATYVRSIQNLHELVILQLQAKPQALPKPELPGKAEPNFTDYGLKAFTVAYNAALKQHQPGEFRIDAYSNIYFELLQKLDVAGKIGGDKPLKVRLPEGASLKVERPDLLILDIHPNDAAKTTIAMNDVAQVIEDALLFEGRLLPERRCTVIVDITLNHIADEKIPELKNKVDKYVASGNLNLVFIQSLAKFAQFGSDKFNGGLLFYYNAPDKWKEFNEEIARSTGEDVLHKPIADYFKALFAFTQKDQVRYIQKVRENTKYVRAQLETLFADLGVKDGVINISENTDEGACYVAFNVQKFVAKNMPPTSINDDLANKEATFMESVLDGAIYPLLAKLNLPVSMRQSFGFPLSNLGAAWRGVRFTIGIETKETLAEYANVIAYLAKKLNDAANDTKSADTIKNLTEPGKRETFLKGLVNDVENRAKLKERLEAMVLAEKSSKTVI